ncbi:hypothetical protein PIB30_088126 [Stylosanthes scabra]|uniref:Uncharacterized protein n=1 Tax=Stylosanthes scabra TaxID=79078 RepID=A0ABU6VVH4_9FABA|nr:hypothetical protein [Stylosanthes scabra]
MISVMFCDIALADGSGVVPIKFTQGCRVLGAVSRLLWRLGSIVCGFFDLNLSINKKVDLDAEHCRAAEEWRVAAILVVFASLLVHEPLIHEDATLAIGERPFVVGVAENACAIYKVATGH